MKYRRLIPVAAGGLCLAVSLSAGWLWQTLAAMKYEAHARLALADDPFSGSDDGASDGSSPGTAEDALLSPEVLTSAVSLMRERGAALSLASPFDSEVDYLLERTRVLRGDRDGANEFSIRCTAPSPDEALQMARAIVDACLAAARSAVPPAAENQPADRAPSERRELAAAIERQERTIAALVEQVKAARQAGDESAGAEDDPAVLETGLSAARRDVAQAEKSLDEARHDLERKLPPETVAGRLEDGPARTRLLEILKLAKLYDDLREQQTLLQKWSAVYGRNHPRMTDIRGRIAQLQQQVTASAIEPGDLTDPSQPAAAPDLVLNALELDLADRQAAVQELETRVAVRQNRLTARQELETQLGEARQELAFLHDEHDRLRQPFDSGRRQASKPATTVIEPPALSSRAAPQAGLPMAVSCVAGMAVYLFVLWHLRSRVPGSRRPRTAPVITPIQARAPTPAARPSAAAGRAPALAPPLVQVPAALEPPARRDRFRSQDEERLARLKMLSTR